MSHAETATESSPHQLLASLLLLYLPRFEMHIVCFLLFYASLHLTVHSFPWLFILLDLISLLFRCNLSQQSFIAFWMYLLVSKIWEAETWFIWPPNYTSGLVINFLIILHTQTILQHFYNILMWKVLISSQLSSLLISHF